MESRTALISEFVGILRSSFATREPIDRRALRKAFAAGDYTGMVRQCRRHVGLDLPIRLGYVNAGRGDVPAFVSMPKPMPPRDSFAFRHAPITLYLRKSFLDSASAEIVAAAIGHELSHVILEADSHQLKAHEEAVDLTAMLFGFRDIYATSARHWQPGRQYGYLDRDEIALARCLIRGDGPIRRWLSTYSGDKLALMAGLIAVVIAVVLVGTSRNAITPTAPVYEGTSQLSRNEIAYCLKERERLRITEGAVNPYSEASVQSFNLYVSNYNARCGSRTYDASDLGDVEHRLGEAGPGSGYDSQ